MARTAGTKRLYPKLSIMSSLFLIAWTICAPDAGAQNVAARGPSEAVTVPVFEWTNPSPELAAEMESNDTYRYIDKYELTPFIIASEMRTFRKGKSTATVALTTSGTHTTISSQPDSGYFEWTLPNFLLPTAEVPEYWRSIEYEFRLPEGESLADYKVPLQFRTSLSPNNKIEIDLTSKGAFLIKGSQSQKELTRYRTSKTIEAGGTTSVKYLISTRGFWSIHVDGELLESGYMDPEIINRGLSNKFWFEGTQHIHRLAISELYHPEDVELARGLPEAALDVIDEALARSFRERVAGYRGLAASEISKGLQIDSKSWRYEGHERTYVRRMRARSAQGDYIVYRVNLIITGSYGDGRTISLPLQYEVPINTEDSSIAGVINLFFNDDDAYRLAGVTDLFPEHVSGKKVVLSSVVEPVTAEVAPSAEAIKEWFAQGKAAYDAKEYEKALPLFKRAAQAGHADAQYYTGRIYGNGLVGEPDWGQAMRHYLLAAEQDQNSALVNLGVLYHAGNGVQRDYEKAFEYFTRSAELGNATAASNLGVMHNHGQGMPVDTLEAARWYRRALEQTPEATATAWRLGVLLIQGGDGLEPDRAEAYKLISMAAEKGNRYGVFHLGRLYENGWGVKRDCAEAVRLYREAAGKGVAEARRQATRLANESC